MAHAGHAELLGYGKLESAEKLFGRMVMGLHAKEGELLHEAFNFSITEELIAVFKDLGKEKTHLLIAFLTDSFRDALTKVQDFNFEGEPLDGKRKDQ